MAKDKKHFEQATTRALAALRERTTTEKLADAAEEKADADKEGRLSEIRGQLKALLRLVRAYARRDYRAISWESLVLIVAGLIYLVNPADAIPDFLPAGLLDDAVVMAFVLGAVAEELDDFIEWEKAQSS